MENASTISTTAFPANDNHDPNERKPPTGVNILLVIIYGGMVGTSRLYVVVDLIT